MILIVCVDDSGGMLFNHRRQSQDHLLRERILRLTAGKQLWMNHYSAKQFDAIPQVKVDDNLLSKASAGEYCFVEDALLSPYEKRAEKIILFKWNRRYPGDLYFDINLNNGSWKMTNTQDFQGSSHEKITMEVYEHE